MEKAYNQNKEKYVLTVISERAQILDVHFSSKTAYNTAAIGQKETAKHQHHRYYLSKDYYNSAKKNPKKKKPQKPMLVPGNGQPQKTLCPNTEQSFLF